MILAIQRQHNGPLIGRIAGFGADLRFPVIGKKRLKLGKLLFKLVGRITGEFDFLPDQFLCRPLADFRRQPRRFGIIKVRQHHNGRWMFEKPVRKFLERQPHIFKADFLADNIEGHCRIAAMHGAHHASQYRPVAHASIEQPQGRRMRRDIVEFHGDSVRNCPLFTAGVDEHQIFLPIVKESEVCLAFSVRSICSGGFRRWISHGQR